MMEHFTVHGLSYVGRRKNNQDSCCADSISKNLHFLAVADGMGGAVGGEIASLTIIETAKLVLDNAVASKIGPDDLKEALSKIFDKSQEALALKIKEDQSLTGMGTTLTCVLLFDDKYVWGNIGDSRVYLVTVNDIKQLTNDHTYIQEHINKHGKDIPEQFYKTYGHIITRSINGENDKPDLYPSDANYKTLNKGELFLLCSDGLISNKVKTDSLAFHEIILGTKELSDTCQNLISHAFFQGSTDNITVVLGEYGNLKRGENKTPTYDYPPKEGRNIEISKNIDNSNIDSNENTEPDRPADLIDENHPQAKNHFSLGKTSKAVLLLILLVFIFGSGGYLLFTNNNNPLSKGAAKRIIEQDEITVVDFNGFEEKEMEVDLDYPDKITWSKYKGDGFKKYTIHIAGGLKNKEFIQKNETHIELSALDIISSGNYKLTIEVILINGTSIPGNKELSLKVK